MKSVNSYQNGFELLIKDLTRWKKEKIQSGTAVRFQNQGQPSGGRLREYDLRAFCPDEGQIQVLPGEIMVTYGNLHRGLNIL